MTSIVEPPRESRPFTWVRIALLMLFLLFGAIGTPWPWAVLWWVIPASVAAGLLLSWRFGRAALALPATLALIATGLTLGLGQPVWFTGWAPLAAVTGCWMGLREEGGGPSIGERAWMLVPLLGLAASLSLLPGFPAAIGRLDGLVLAEQQHMAQLAQQQGGSKMWVEASQQYTSMPVEERRQAWLVLVPFMMFLWSALLVMTGRAMAARIASVLNWPPLSRSPLPLWRLPDAALVPLIVGVALFVFGPPAWHPSAWTLLVFSALGYSVQGVAVVESLLLARGMPPVFVALTMLFVMAVSLLWILPAVAVVGLSDVWLDYRRLEPAPEGEA